LFIRKTAVVCHAVTHLKVQFFITDDNISKIFQCTHSENTPLPLSCCWMQSREDICSTWDGCVLLDLDTAATICIKGIWVQYMNWVVLVCINVTQHRGYIELIVCWRHCYLLLAVTEFSVSSSQKSAKILWTRCNIWWHTTFWPEKVFKPGWNGVPLHI